MAPGRVVHVDELPYLLVLVEVALEVVLSGEVLSWGVPAVFHAGGVLAVFPLEGIRVTEK